MHSFSLFLLLLVTQLEMTFLEICFWAAVSDDALKDKIGSIRPSIFLLCVHGVIGGVSGTMQYTVSSPCVPSLFLELIAIV